MLLALVSGQDRSTVARWERSAVKGDVIIARRSKTDVKVAIPTALRLDAIGMSLADVIAKCKATHVVSKYLIHHVRSVGRVSRGDAVWLATVSSDEIRSLSKRLYMEQGGVDTRALLGPSDRRHVGPVRQFSWTGADQGHDRRSLVLNEF